MKYEVKLTMKGKIPSEVENFKYEISEAMFDDFHMEVIKKVEWGEAKKIP